MKDILIKDYEIAIIGAGVIGGMTARTLAKYNLKICILEKENSPTPKNDTKRLGDFS